MNLITGMVYLAGMLYAQGPKMEPVRTVVTVTARPAPVEAGSADVTIVNLNDTSAAHPQAVADILRFQPGLYVGQTGGRGGLTLVSLRGGDPNFTLLMIDGIPVNDITDVLGGTVDVGAMLPLDASRVEIVRGPMSALYGSEPVSGVVNVITGEADRNYWDVSFSAGRFGAVQGGLDWGGRARRLSYHFAVAGTRVGEQVERDSFDATDGSGGVTFSLGKATSLGTQFRVHRFGAEGFPAGSGGPRYALNRATESRGGESWLVGTALRHAREMWSHVAGFDVWRQAQEQDTPAILDRIPPSFSTIPPTVASTEFRRTRVNGSISAHAASGWTATAGAVYRNEWGWSVGRLVGFGPANYGLDRNTGATFGEAVLERKRWSAIAGVRSDWVTGGTHRWSPRVGASAALWKGGRARASWGRAFKMPSFYALGQPFFGNPGLLPESSESEDAGIEQGLGRAGSVGASLYRTVYRQLVDFSPELFRLVNRSEAIARGIDLVWRERWSHGLSAQAHATYSSTRLVDSTERLRDRPRWRAGATLTAPAGSRTNLCAEALWVASRFDFQVPVPWMDRAPSYVTVNASVDRRITTALAGFVRVDNLLNRKYQEYVGFPNPGIQVRAGLRYSPQRRGPAKQ